MMGINMAMKKTTNIKCTLCSFEGKITLVRRKTKDIIFKDGLSFNVTGDCPQCGLLLISYHTTSEEG